MSRRRALEVHKRNLGEIREIMNAMKSLAYIETRKLTRRLEAQRAVVASIEAAAGDFAGFHPGGTAHAAGLRRVELVIGTERGFCGDLNRVLLDRAAADSGAALVAVGRKLHGLVEERADVAARVAGAETAEEVGAVLARVVAQLGTLGEHEGAIALAAIYPAERGVVRSELLPPAWRAAVPRSPFPPAANLEPSVLSLALAEQYLFAALNVVLLEALMEENHRRVTHLDAAIRHLDDQNERLGRRLNALRQEEIIEEIEVILLSAGGSR